MAGRTMRTTTRRLQARFGEDVLVFVFLAVLCAALLALVLFALSGESRRSRLLLEYEAEETAMALLMMYMGPGELPDLQSLERRVLGFGLYRGDGSALTRQGSAPAQLSLSAQGPRPGFPRMPPAELRFHPERGTVSLVRWVSHPPGPMGAPPRAAPHGMPEMMGRMMRGDGPQALFLELRGEDHWARSGLYRAARIGAPLAVVGVMAAMALLYRRNSVYRRRLAAQEQLARLGEISRTLSHEIKNPLSAIRIQTAYLRKTLPEPRRGELQVIEEEVARLGLLTERVGDFLRDPRGEPEPIDVEEFLGELARRFDRGVEFPAREPGVGGAATGGRCIVRFDRQRLRSVLENLIRNALEANEAASGGGAAAQVAAGAAVQVAVRPGRGRAEIAVLDRGPGIPAELLEKAFDPFYTTKTHGSGIGLSVARRFVEAAGGSLLLSNRPAGGLEARVVLPREPA